MDPISDNLESSEDAQAKRVRVFTQKKLEEFQLRVSQIDQQIKDQ